MGTPYRLLLLIIVVVLGSYGWGDAVIRRLWRDEPAPEDLTVALRITVGLALFMALGGFAVALGVARFGELLGWQLVGIAIAALTAATRLRRGRPRWQLRGAWQFGSLAVLGGFVAYLAFGVAATGPSNVYDDDPGYLYLAQRLLSTGGLIDPFNMRRITSYGSAELFQAMTLRVGGNSWGLLVEWFLFPLLLLALVVGRARRPFAPVALAVLGLGLVLVRPVGVWSNVAPTFSGTVLTVATLQLLAPVRRDEVPWGRYALCGLLLAASLSLRLEFCLVAGLVVVLVALTRLKWRDALACIALAAGVFLVGIAGWAVALQRSSGTLLYPFIAGNWNTAFPWNNAAVHTARQYLDRFAHQLTVNGLGWMLAGSLAILAALLVYRRFAVGARKRDSALAVLGFAVVGCVVELAVETTSLTGANAADIGRYSIPSALACLLYAMDVAWRSLTPERGVPAPNGAVPGPSVAAVFARVGLGVLALAGFALALEVTPAGYASRLSAQASEAAGVLGGTHPIVERWAGVRPQYQRLNRLVPRGSYVLAAVDTPAFLDFSRYRFATLDIAGATSPPPHLPIFGSAPAAIAYLRHLGIDGIVASSTRTGGLYSERPWSADLHSGIYDYQVLGRYFVAWANLLDAFEHDPQVTVTRVHTLIYLSFAPTSKR